MMAYFDSLDDHFILQHVLVKLTQFFNSQVDLVKSYDVTGNDLFLVMELEKSILCCYLEKHIKHILDED